MTKPFRKNVKHKTQVIAWDEVPRSICDLNFRPPNSERLRVGIAEAWSYFVMATLVGEGLAAMLAILLGQYFAALNPALVFLSAGVIGGLAMLGLYRPLPKVVSKQRSFVVAGATIVGVCAGFVVFRLVLVNDTLVSGTVLLPFALLASLIVADQFTGHLLFWITARPSIPHDEMVTWRNTWRCRFLESHGLGCSPKDIASLSNYWFGYLTSTIAIGLPAILVLIVLPNHRWTGLAMAIASTAFVVGWASVLVTTQRSTSLMSCAFGQWLKNQRAGRTPPWVTQSPFGHNVARQLATYASCLLLGFAWLLLAVTDFSVDQHRATCLSPVVGSCRQRLVVGRLCRDAVCRFASCRFHKNSVDSVS